MGRPAKTEHQHFVEGTTSKAKHALESVYEGGRPKIPAHLSAAARTEFKRACKILLDRGTATQGDFANLALYAEVYVRWVDQKRQLGNEFIVTTQVTNNNGTLTNVERPNPLVKMVVDSERQLFALAKSLGLTPGDRDRVRKTKGAREAEQVLDPLEAFMARTKRPTVIFSKEQNREQHDARTEAKSIGTEDGDSPASAE